MNGSGWVTTAVAVTGTELRRAVRDRTALFFILVLPVIIMVIIGGTVFSQVESDASIGVFVEPDGNDAGNAVDALIASLDAADGITIERFSDLDAMVRSIRIAGESAGIVIPARLDERLEAGETVELTLIAVPGTGGSATVRSRLLELVTERGTEIALERLAVDTGLDPTAVLAGLDTANAMVGRVDVEITSVSESDADTNQYSYTAAANLVLFVFINSLVGGAALAQGRRLGVFRRALAAPVTAAQVLVGVGASRLVFALIQSALLIAVAILLFDVSFGDPLAGLLLVVVFAGLSSAAGVLVGALASSPDSAQAASIPIALAMAMLGGCMWPLEIVGDLMRTVGHAVPHAWAMDAWVDLVFDQGSVIDVLPELAILGGYTVVAVGVGSWALRRSLLA